MWNWMARDSGKGTALPTGTLQVWKKGHCFHITCKSIPRGRQTQHGVSNSSKLTACICRPLPHTNPCSVRQKEKSLTASHRGNGREIEAEGSSWQSFLMWIIEELFLLLLKQKLWALNTKNWRRVWHGHITDRMAEHVFAPLAHYVKGEKSSSS